MYGKSEWTCTCFHKISNAPVCDSSFKSSHLISVELPKLPKSQRTSCRERYLKGLVCIWQNLLCSRNVEALQPAQRGKLLYLVCAFWAAVKTPVENDTPVEKRSPVNLLLLQTIPVHPAEHSHPSLPSLHFPCTQSSQLTLHSSPNEPSRHTEREDLIKPSNRWVPQQAPSVMAPRSSLYLYCCPA